MSKLAQKIKLRMSELGINQQELAELVGLSQVSVHKLVSGKTGSTTKIFEIAKALQCDPSWLVGDEDVPVEINHTKSAAESNANWSGGIETWDDSTPLRDDEVEIPFLNEVELSAGNGAVCSKEYEGPKLRFSKATLRRGNIQQENVVCVNISGNSMEPVMPNRATVGVDTGEKYVVDGDIYAIDHDGLLRIKILQNLPGGGLRLRSFNSDEYPDENYDAESRKLIRIIGRIFWYSVLTFK
ncbi:S24 family peptidase [Veronia pacifica]|uniref:XRE family transcriptional regulator n=1 Tax=Veronia pacifica TaxID=1080227 RepID=A0A1C3ELF7_9GAMM|nr:helix-turn-helix transcriptional regulator [Veronia pacifica]ODA34061.1 XRE family transcriptional regulator [Veronia pacifica]